MIKVSLVGNPNTGKTTLYNCLTGANEHVGNWHGVTVEEKSRVYSFEGQEIEIVDLPGIYSLTSLSYEEEVAVKYILQHRDNIVINICDASNLQRNLYLTLGLLEAGAKVILAVNQIDKKPNCKIDYQKLSKLLKIPVVAINPTKKIGIKQLNQAILNYKQQKIELEYAKNLNLLPCLEFLNGRIEKNQESFYAIKLLERDERLFAEKNIDINTFDDQNGISRVAKARYDFVDNVVADCCSKRVAVYGQSKLDKIFLNRFLALPIFFGLLALVFYLTFFSVGRFLSDVLVQLLNVCLGRPLVLFAQSVAPGSWLVSFVENGLVGGASSVLGFLPQVALLFFFLSLLEDSGYLSRVAFVFDDILSKVGLSGKSVYTLLMGFGCSTTAILTSRNMEDKNSKIKTALLTPYMSCSAKFPIYAVLGGAFFGANNIFVIMGLYLLGVVVSVFLSFVFEKTVLKSKAQTFILEFPPYHSMSAKRICSVLWKNVKDFLVRVGSLIISMNIIVWVLSSFSWTFRFVQNGQGSMLESLGRIFSPVFSPLGFSSWGLVSALIAGLVAKEVIVSSIFMFSGLESQSGLASAFSNPTSAVFFASPNAVLSYLVFCLLYFPCLASVGVLSKEIGKKWTILGCLIEFATAYLTAFLIHALSFLGWAALLLVAAVIITTFAICFVAKTIRRKKTCSRCAGRDKRCNKK